MQREEVQSLVLSLASPLTGVLCNLVNSCNFCGDLIVLRFCCLFKVIESDFFFCTICDAIFNGVLCMTFVCAVREDILPLKQE